MKLSRLYVVALVAALGAAVALYLFYKSPVETGVLEASGQVEGTQITVSSRLGGTLEVVAVREGERVSRGDLIARVSAKETEARVAQARAQVATLEAQVMEVSAQLAALEHTRKQARLGVEMSRDVSSHQIHRAREALERSRAEIAVAQADVDRDALAYERYEKLRDQGFVSPSYFDDIRARRQASDARLQAAKRAEQEALATEQQARAASTEVRIKERETARLAAEYERLQAVRTGVARQIDAASAHLAEAEATLADTRLTAPTDGTVIGKLAESGELAAPGRPIARLVDLNDLYVRVYVAERELGKLRLGNPARVLVDAFPGKPFSGRVVEVSQEAEFTPKEAHMKDEREKTVFAVKVAVDNPAGYLKPGMPADVRIRWKDDAGW